jgi:Lrp/AsnC family leucine-responsive transcriptional regulator
MELDDFDRRLPDAVQEDSRRTGEALAAMVGLSPAACLRRLQRLRAAGVIEREVAIVDPRFTPARLGLIVNVTLERERPDLVDDFARSMRRAPEVSQCYYVTGAVDYVLLVSVADMEAYREFTRRHLFGTNVRRFETMVVMGRMKSGTSVPMADAS